ncbi:Fur family transcriptional regulator [Campylobacter mucosalis]|uniref:Transcriptional regulator, Fur family n=1 Tax=Campylobacter mucosalis CCUG 21559 TaxID=1032067 RepID=A0A6G5QIY3_9BACT|nr:transcriptional repressor [Campylobacter mucosalis]KEA45448.1 Fur family transcriptional regulator [Campylobacter mucosalis]QCD45582.1 transcriptional regulator, Fur family [Campylobacter mucosalis CCUG 21559]QKF63772.1 transcriptional regulator, Fur family [Campylobacter mucosalis]
MNVVEFLNKHSIAITPLRVKIIEILNEKKEPLSYDEILSKLEANKTTFYRNMQLFEAQGIVTSFEKDHKNYYELGSGAKAYFVCDICHKVTNIKVPFLKEAKLVKSAVIKGVCNTCE